MTKIMKYEARKIGLLPLERWEEEGGKSALLQRSLPAAGRFVRSMRLTTGTRDLPRQWNSKFSIEPLRTGIGNIHAEGTPE